MSNFADFALLAAIPSYGGAEILRAQRILPSGPGPRVHLALFGRSEAVARRVVAVAEAAARVEHPALARIYEVGRFDGIVYGVGDPAEGVDVASILVADKTRRRTPPMELAIGITLAVARVVEALHDAGDTWAAEGSDVGLATAFPGGLAPATLFLDPQTGGVRLRLLASAAGDPEAPSTFRAPERSPSMAGDVYSLGRLLMALLAGDPQGLEVPRLSASSSVVRFLPRLLEKRPDDRPDLRDVIERLEGFAAEMQSTPEQAVVAALAGPYRTLVVDTMPGLEPPPRIVDDIRMRLGFIYGAVQRLYPAPPPQAAMLALPTPLDEGAPVFTDRRPGAARRGRTAATVLIPAVEELAFARRAGGKTSPTLLIPTIEAQKALPAPGAPNPPASKRTVLIDPSTFVPFAPPPPAVDDARTLPPPPPLVAPPPPPSLEEAGTARRAPPPPSALSSPGMNISSVFAQSEVTAPGVEPPRRAPRSPASDAPSQGGVVPVDPSDIGLVPVDDEHTTIAPPPSPSLPGADTAPRPASPDALATATAPGSSGQRFATRYAAPPPLLSADISAEPPDAGDATALISNVPDLSAAEDEPEEVDGGAFLMVGDKGRTFGPEDNPFAASTRLVPQQALQKARSASDSLDSVDVDVSREDEEADAAPWASAGPAEENDGATEMYTPERMQQLMASAERAARPSDVAAPPATLPPTPRATPPQTSLPTSLSRGPATAEGFAQPASSNPNQRADRPQPSPPRTSLIIEAPDGARVLVNGTEVGTGRVTMDVAPEARAVVKVLLPGHLPWSSVVQMGGRPRVRVKPTLKPK